MKRNASSGFSVVEILILIVVVAILGLLGWNLYNNQTQADSTNSSNQAENTSTAEQIDSTKTLEITEWGVKGTYNGNSLTYKITTSSDSNGPDFVEFSSSETTGTVCEGSAVGIIVRYEPTDTIFPSMPQPSASGSADLVPASEYLGKMSATELADKGVYKVGSNYYFIQQPQDQCSFDDNSLDAPVSDVTSSMSSILKSLSSI